VLTNRKESKYIFFILNGLEIEFKKKAGISNFDVLIKFNILGKPANYEFRNNWNWE
jgi:hypothetical protein